MTRWIVGLLLGAAFLAALLLATLRETRIECEVCMEFDGRTACRSVGGADREAATRDAVSNACAVLSSGVTQGMACNRTLPRSTTCTE